MVETKAHTNLDTVVQSLGVRVREAPTPKGTWGIYDKPRHLITISPGLNQAQYRSTLAHELGHARYGHHGHHPKTEKLADKWAAKKLITFDLLLEQAQFTLATSEIAAQLNVMPWVVEAFVNTLNAKQVVEMMNQIAEFQA